MPEYFNRLLNLDLPRGKSAFLWGARQSGKTMYLRQKFKDSVYFDLLDFDEIHRFSARPRILGELLAALPPDRLQRPVILDEIQNVPNLLNEVHRLIESEGLSFILCGSSAHKLKRPGINLLGGRAWRFAMHPLSMLEVDNFDLIQALNHGLLPKFYLEQDQRNLDGYVRDYLKTEIHNEAYVKNLGAFGRFFSALSYCHGEVLNYSAIARDCAVSHHTVRNYFNILEGTLMGHLIYPFSRATGRQTISAAPKFYLFDVGVANRICGRVLSKRDTHEFGKAFEHFILMELILGRDLLNNNYEIQYWRTNNRLEVDFVLGSGEIAIEVKSRVRQGDLRPIQTFVSDNSPKRAIVVTAEAENRKINGIEVMPYQDFIGQLHAGALI